MNTAPASRHALNAFLWLAAFFAVLAWSAVEPADRLTWWLEVTPALGALAILIATYRVFPLTPLLYRWLLLHCLVLMIGGHYTYAHVPAFDWLSQLFGWQRNNFDKLGHFLQGFVPAIIAREVLIRFDVFRKTAWMPPIIVGVCLGISAFYEFLEWWAAVIGGGSAEAFLGTQGYEWDTQSDMFLAMAGAIAALALLARRHDRQLAALPRGTQP